MVNSTADIFLAPMKKPALGGLGFVHQSGKGGAVSSSAPGQGCRQLSAEPGGPGTKRPRRGRLRRGLVLSVSCLQGRLNVSNARLM